MDAQRARGRRRGTGGAPGGAVSQAPQRFSSGSHVHHAARFGARFDVSHPVQTARHRHRDSDRRDERVRWFRAGAGDWLFSGSLSGLLAPRGEYFHAGRASRYAANCGRTPAAISGGTESEESRSIPERLGDVGSRSNGEPPVISGVVLLSITARQSILAGSAQHHPRYLQPGDGGHRRNSKVAGATDF